MPKSDIDDLVFKPHFGKAGSSCRVPTFKQSILSRTNALSRKGAGPRAASRGRPAQVRLVKGQAAQPRRVIIKARVVKMNSAGAKKALGLHMSYIQRDGVERDGSKGQLYGKDADFDRDAFTADRAGEPHHFRLVLSPEDAHELDLSRWTRDVMQQMQTDLGQPLDWSAVNHYNTDHPHVHVVVRGLDAKGQELFIPRDYISSGLRHRAQDLATLELGPRTEHEIEQALDQEVTKQRYTSLDRKLEKLAQSDGKLDLGPYPQSCQARLSHQRLVGRLETLERMGLAHKADAPGSWQLAPDVSKTLKDLGQRGDIIKQMDSCLSSERSAQLNIYAQPSEIVRPIEGKVVKKGFADELYDRPYLVVASADGAAHWVPLKRPEQLEACSMHQVVHIESKRLSWVKPLDHEIEKIAALTNGRVLETKQVIAGSKPSAVQTRLEQLHRQGLVQKDAERGFVVPADLVQKLEARNAEQPIQALRIQARSPSSIEAQITTPGPSWLDHQPSSDPCRARHGFGAEVALAVKKREAFLNSLGIDPKDGNTLSKLRHLERKQFIEKEVKQSSFTYAAPKQGRAVTGTVSALTLASGQKVALIKNERSRTFTLTAWRKEFEPLVSKHIELSMQQGRLHIHHLERSRGR